jgi:hypothetical protein
MFRSAAITSDKLANLIRDRLIGSNTTSGSTSILERRAGLSMRLKSWLGLSSPQTVTFTTWQE